MNSMVTDCMLINSYNVAVETLTFCSAVFGGRASVEVVKAK